MIVIAALAMLAQSPISLAFDSAPGNPTLDRFNIDLGSYYYGTGTSATLNGTAGRRGVPIDLEHDLGMRDVNRFRVDAYW